MYLRWHYKGGLPRHNVTVSCLTAFYKILWNDVAELQGSEHGAWLGGCGCVAAWVRGRQVERVSEPHAYPYMHCTLDLNSQSHSLSK